MGIKGLWSVLTPFSEKKSLHEVRGETLAVDLSGWVCDSQNVTEYHIQPKMYLRNLFFRTIYLLLADITPIFVLEGDAPALKQNVMAARNAIQFRGAPPKSESNAKKPDITRRRFAGVLKECENLLKSMGVTCIKGRGEAEATCAQLNAQGLVDAVISQDSDCFAYGARRVYRNFSVSSAAGGGAMAGSVDCYDAHKMFHSNGFGRKKMVALALLCGCDYGEGACGTSITTVVTFLHTVPEDDVIPRLLSWVTDVEHFEERTRWAAAPGRCDRCGHVGRTHLKNGCPVCATNKGCSDHGHKAKVAEVKRELSLRSRALSCGALFPEPKVMKEFMNTVPERFDLDSVRRPAPSLIQFTKIMSKKLDWSERYCVEKFLPLLTKLHLQETIPCKTIRPINIKKKRNPKGVPSFEVVWADINGDYEALIPDEQYEVDEDRSVPWTSIERQDLMRQYYPDIVEAYEESIKKPIKEKKTKGRKKKDEDPDKPKRKYTRKTKKDEPKTQSKTNNVDIDAINNSLKTLELNSSKVNVSVSVNKLKRKLKSKKGQKTIDSFISKKRKKSLNYTSLRRSFASFLNDNPNDKENEATDHWLSILSKTVEDNEGDLSNLVERMVNKPIIKKTVKVDNKLVKLVFSNFSTPKKPRKSLLSEIQNHCSTPKDSHLRKSVLMRNSGINSLNNSVINRVNTSLFFDKLSEGRDAFEMSLEHKSAVIDFDSTEDYSLPDICL